MARVLVAGGKGLLGSTLVPALLARAHDARILGRGASNEVRVDLTDTRATAAALQAQSPDVIINLAAATNVDACERDPAAAFAANALAVRSLAEWVANRNGRAQLIQISTDQVYSGPGLHAEDGPRPINYYAYSKLLGEQYALGAGAMVLRTNLFGRSRCADRASLSDWLVDRLSRGERTEVFTDVSFSPLSLETLSHLICDVVERPVRGIFNLGSRGGMSKADFAFALAAALGLSTEMLVRGASSNLSLAARRPLDMRMDCSLFERTFGRSLPALDAEINSMRKHYANRS